MKKSRRQFLGTSLALGASPFIVPSSLLANISKPENNLNILILGGTSFLGPHQIAYALQRGHKVTTFTRGKTKPKIHTELFNQVEQLIGDREDNLEALNGREWDVVIDNSGRKVKWTRDTAELLKKRTKYYMYTSSISVYYPYTGSDFTEERKLVLETPKDVTEDEKYTYEYGVMKANSENAALEAFGEDRTMIVRPTFIIGEGDPTDRFPYWPARLEQGGEIIIPGKPNETIQYIDVRDLAEWMIRLLENGLAGTYNGSGPGHDMTMTAFVHGAHACFNTPVSYVHIDDINFLKEHDVYAMYPWVIPLPEFAGMAQSDNSKAIKAGLTFRPLADTVQSTLDWWHSEAVSAERRENLLSGEKSFMTLEKEVLTKWKEHLNSKK